MESNAVYRLLHTVSYTVKEIGVFCVHSYVHAWFSHAGSPGVRRSKLFKKEAYREGG